jgi:hypothetical protein
MQHVRRFFILEDGCMVCWFMVFNATFNNKFQLYRGGQFYRRRKPEYPEKTGVPGENRSTRRKPEDPEKTRGPGENQVTTVSPEWDSNSQH